MGHWSISLQHCCSKHSVSQLAKETCPWHLSLPKPRTSRAGAHTRAGSRKQAADLPPLCRRAAAPEEGDEAGDGRDGGRVDGGDGHAHEHIPDAERWPARAQQVVVEETCEERP